MNKRVGANRRKKKRDAIAKIKADRFLRRCLSYGAFAVVLGAVCVGGFVASRGALTRLSALPAFTVRSIEVCGARRISASEIRRLSGLCEGARMFAVKPAVAEKAIAGNCWIRKVRVARHFPDKLVIAVEEREPIALVNAGRIFYLDKEGVLLPLFKGTYSELPVISGIIANADASVGKKISEENLKRVRSFLAEAGKTDVLSARHVSQIDFAGASDIKLKMENSPTLVEIDDRQGPVELKRLKGLLDIFDNSSEGAPRRINLCYDNLAYAQW